LKTLYLVTLGMDPKGTGAARWTMRWKPALNAFAVTFADACRPPRTSNKMNARTTVRWTDPEVSNCRGGVGAAGGTAA